MTDARARALLTRLGAFLDHFTRYSGRRAHRTYASRYVQGLLNDSERKSMQAMHGQLSGPGSYLSYTARGAGRGVPHLAAPDVARTILERLQRLSLPFGTRIAIEQGVGVIRPAAETPGDVRK